MAVKGTRVLVGAVQMLLQTGSALGLQRQELLRAAAVDEEQLSDRDAYVPFGVQLAIGEAIIRQRPKVNIAVVALQNLSPATLGVLGYVISNVATLHDALALFMRFQRLLSDGLRWRLELDEHATVVVDVDPDYQRLGYPVEGLVGLWLKLGRLLTGRDWRPLSVAFRHAPRSNPSSLEGYFGTRIQFRAARNELTMPGCTLQSPLAVGKVALQPSLRQLAQARLHELGERQRFSDRLRELLFEQIPQGVTDKASLARMLGVSARTLNRRLRAEQQTFRDMLDDARRELAQSWLGDPNVAIYEVAFLLGYSEPSTFHRSFRRWTGCSPRVWRAQRLVS